VRHPFLASGESSLVVLCVLVVLCCPGSLTAQSTTRRGANPEPSPDVTFHSGTRLVEIEVVVRDKNGPVKGLTREDFTLLDAGKHQQIAVFNSENAARGAEIPPIGAADSPLSKGSFSNRTDRAGHPIRGATVLLLDQLNTSFDNQGYSRSQVLKFLASSQAGEQIAIYLLGKKLTVVQDFTDDRETLTNAVRKWNPENLGLLIESDELMDATDRKAGDMSSPVYQLIRNQISAEAIAKIAQHLSRLPGRKNLVWLSDTPGAEGSQFLWAANIHLYPVLTRGVGSSGVVAWMRDTREMGRAAAFATPALPAGNEIAVQHANAALAAANGAEAFMDSRDISVAVRTALEDAGSSYVLGFYPAEETLDNKFHAITVNVGRRGTARGNKLDISYRPGYFASTVAPPAAPVTSLDDLLRNPLDGSAIGLTATAGSANGRYEINVTVDLKDIQFETKNNRHDATVALSFADDAPRKVRTAMVKLSYSDDEFTTALERGLLVTMTFEEKSAVRVVAQDSVTGLAGSLRVPPAQETIREK
jgi:VWFA-related protein